MALRRIQEVKPDIALLDVIMPEVSGYEVCEKVKKDPVTSRIPVLLLTGTFEPFDRKRAEAVGAEGHLTKPFESQALIAKVEELIADSRRTVVEEPTTATAVVVPLPGSSGAGRLEAEPVAPLSAEYDGANGREGIVPDRYDDTGEGRAPWEALEPKEAGTVKTASDTSPVGFDSVQGEPFEPIVDPVAETWDELASGLSSASAPPRGAVPATEFPSAGLPLPDLSAPASSGSMDRGAAASPRVPVPESPAAGWTGESATSGSVPSGLTPEDLGRIAARVVEQLSDRVVREIAWEVIPEIAESLIRRRIQELEEKITREG